MRNEGLPAATFMLEEMKIWLLTNMAATAAGGALSLANGYELAMISFYSKPM